MTLYWNNILGTSWNTISNWFQDADSTIPAVSVPWTQDDEYKTYDLTLATGATLPPVITSNIGNIAVGHGFIISGNCDIANLFNNSAVYSGIFSGANFTNNYTSNKGIFGGTFSGDNFANYGNIFGGTFSGLLINSSDIINIGIYNGIFTNVVTNNGNIFNGTFSNIVTNNIYIYGGSFTNSLYNYGTIVNSIVFTGSAFSNSGTIQYLNLTNPSCNKIYSNISLNANYDIVWSFQYSLSNNSQSSGGFATFLYDPTVLGNIKDSGAPSLGFGIDQGYNVINNLPMSFTQIPGIVLAIGFDLSGAFGTGNIFNASGQSHYTPNSFTVRTGTTLSHLSTFALTAFNISNFNQQFKTLRFNLSNVAQTLQISYLDNNVYKELALVDVPLSISNTTEYNVGLAYSAPLYNNNNQQSIFEVTNFHTHGISQIPTTVEIIPNIFPDYTPPVIVPPVPPVPPVIPLSAFDFGLSANEGYNYTGYGLYETQNPDYQTIDTQANTLPIIVQSLVYTVSSGTTTSFLVTGYNNPTSYTILNNSLSTWVIVDSFEFVFTPSDDQSGLNIIPFQVNNAVGFNTYNITLNVTPSGIIGFDSFEEYPTGIIASVSSYITTNVLSGQYSPSVTYSAAEIINYAAYATDNFESYTLSATSYLSSGIISGPVLSYGPGIVSSFATYGYDDFEDYGNLIITPLSGIAVNAQFGLGAIVSYAQVGYDNFELYPIGTTYVTNGSIIGNAIYGPGVLIN